MGIGPCWWWTLPARGSSTVTTAMASLVHWRGSVGTGLWDKSQIWILNNISWAVAFQHTPSMLSSSITSIIIITIIVIIIIHIPTLCYINSNLILPISHRTSLPSSDDAGGFKGSVRVPDTPVYTWGSNRANHTAR